MGGKSLSQTKVQGIGMLEQNITVKMAVVNLMYIPFISLLQYLKLDGEVIAIFSVLLILDIITGWFKVISLGMKPRSWRLANGIISKVVMIIIPLVMALGAKAIHVDITGLFYIVIDALVLSEVYSVLGNIYTINTKKNVEEFDVLSKILKLIRNTLNKMLKDSDNV